MKRLRTAVAVAAGLVVVTVVAGSAVSASGDEQSASAGATQAAAPAAQAACQEDLVREALDNSGAVDPDLEYEITYLKCAEGFGWAVIDPIPENVEPAIALLRVSDTEIEVLDIGTSLCTADYGIPADVAAQIAPPGTDPAGDCPTTVPPPSITVSPSTAAQGDTVTISGNASACSPEGNEVRLTSTVDLFPPDGFGPLLPLDANGDFETTYTIPADTPPGTYSIGLRCGGGNVGVSTTLHVTQAAAPAAPVPAQPSFTG
jgi:hypothetical protein